jgi:diketogulonate reductase-like aldo/keto reductase
VSEPVSIPTDTLALPGGAIPLVGFGTWQLRGDECYDGVLVALETGYRHLDTATVYGNEAEVGRALADSGVPRDEVFVTTKYNPRSGRPELDVLGRSLDALGVDHVDLWLVHAPVDDRRNAAVWDSFGQARSAGTARDIGVSNFSVEQVDHVSAGAGPVPAVNQIEWRPSLYDAQLVAAHESRGVVVEGYSALKGGSLTDPVVTRIAEEAGRTPAQVLVRWHVQHGIVVIPRSSKAERIRSNADVGGFELSEEQMAALDGLGRRSGTRR